MNIPRSIRNLVLGGFMGSGKSSVGRLVAAQLRFRYVDTDELIEQRAGRTITQIFTENGEPFFRELEAQVVAELAQYENAVISTGGGMTANEANLASLKQHALVICLWASPETIWERVRHQSHRPLLRDPDPLEKIRKLLTARAPFYKQADALVISEGRSVKEVAQHVIHQFHLARRQVTSP